MNKVREWFYKKAQTSINREIEEYGLKVIDKKRLDQHIIKSSRRDMVYISILVVLVIMLIIKYLWW